MAEGRLWARLRAAIRDGDEETLAQLRAEYGDPDALHAALMADAKEVTTLLEMDEAIDVRSATDDGRDTDARR